MLGDQVQEFRPRMVCCAGGLEETDHLLTDVTFTPMEEMVQAVDVDLVMVATTGRAGLLPTLEALKAGKEVALANKEVIIMAGEMVMGHVGKYDGVLLPVDSEPSAIWQCLRGEDRDVRRIIVTASGGAFRHRQMDELQQVTPEEALNHPTWKMGKRITVDSATLTNKAFEVIEVHHLFQTPWEKIEVVIHPQSIVHSMVEFADGSVKAQLSPPDMRLPIQYALFYPRRVVNESLGRFDTTSPTSLDFEPLDLERYPCFALALETGKRGGTYPAVLCAADETAVELFLQGKVRFTDIPRIVERVVDQHQPPAEVTLETILEADAWARELALAQAGK
jgi:1-deoxy-D-xylulose-5-phosphate reductoisomerase